jgi:hypothetical protein
VAVGANLLFVGCENGSIDVFKPTNNEAPNALLLLKQTLKVEKNVFSMRLFNGLIYIG